MSRLIDADALKRKLEGRTYRAKGKFIKMIDDMPTIEAEPIKRGEWQITEAYPHNVYCSVCHKRFAQTHWAVWEDGSLPRAYCPNCGAKMENEDEQL